MTVFFFFFARWYLLHKSEIFMPCPRPVSAPVSTDDDYAGDDESKYFNIIVHVNSERVKAKKYKSVVTTSDEVLSLVLYRLFQTEIWNYDSIIVWLLLLRPNHACAFPLICCAESFRYQICAFSPIQLHLMTTSWFWSKSKILTQQTKITRLNFHSANQED